MDGRHRTLSHPFGPLYFAEGSEEPLSARSYLFVGEEKSLLFDAGANPEQPVLIHDFLKKEPEYIAYSHFHADHVGNQRAYPSSYAYGSKMSAKHAKVDEIVLSPKRIDLGGVSLTLFPVPSSHAKGCLVLRIDSAEVYLLGDLLSPNVNREGAYYDRSLFHEMAKWLRSLPPEAIFFPGHGGSGEQEPKNQKEMDEFLSSIEDKMKGLQGPFLPWEE